MSVFPDSDVVLEQSTPISIQINELLAVEKNVSELSPGVPLIRPFPQQLPRGL
jgi:hypothetical protein